MPLKSDRLGAQVEYPKHRSKDTGPTSPAFLAGWQLVGGCGYLLTWAMSHQILVIWGVGDDISYPVMWGLVINHEIRIPSWNTWWLGFWKMPSLLVKFMRGTHFMVTIHRRRREFPQMVGDLKGNSTQNVQKVQVRNHSNSPKFIRFNQLGKGRHFCPKKIILESC